MTRGRKLPAALVAPSLALLALLTIAAAAPSFADRRAQETRSSEGSRPAMTRSSDPAPSASRGASRPASVSRGSRTAVQTRQSTPASRSRSSGGRHYGHSRHHTSVHVGYWGYPWRSWWWGPSYSWWWGPNWAWGHPFYWGVPWGVPYYHGHHAPRWARAEAGLGAFDLNVRPRKADVYLNGQLIGRARQFDGWPDYLWLQRGEYELIFYRPGFATERRLLQIVPGVVSEVRLELATGEAVAPSELSDPPAAAPTGAMAEVKEAYRRQSREPAAGSTLDTRTPPGRLRLSVLPADASVYLDGRLLGSGEELSRLHAGLVVDAGSHLLEVVRPGYATERLEFAVDEGDEVELEVLLEAG